MGKKVGEVTTRTTNGCTCPEGVVQSAPLNGCDAEENDGYSRHDCESDGLTGLLWSVKRVRSYQAYFPAALYAGMVRSPKKDGKGLFTVHK